MQRSLIKRRVSTPIQVGDVTVGGDAPIAVQSMTNTLTTNVADTVAQINQLIAAGADIVRVSVPDFDAVEAFSAIRKQVTVPLVADIHFDYRIALQVADYGADCLRINPGNIGNEQRIAAVIGKAKDKNIPIRIGVNGGSLERDLVATYGEPCAAAMVDSALRQIDILEKHNFSQYKLSLKASDVYTTLEAYRSIASQISNPLHLGVTEAGGLCGGTVKSALGIGTLLLEGIGDTIRVSLAADPVEEVKVGYEILKSLGLRQRGVNFIACPGCSRQHFNVIETVNNLEERLSDLTDPIDVAIIGCYVNGPGESKQASLGVTGGPSGNLLYIDGKAHHKISSDALVDSLEAEIRAQVVAKRQ